MSVTLLVEKANGDLQIWAMDLGEGPVQPAFRVGDVIFVDPDLVGGR